MDRVAGAGVGGGEGLRGGGGGLFRCHHQDNVCIQMSSDQNHLHFSLIVKGNVTRQRPHTTASEEKGEPKRGIELTSYASQPDA